MLKLAMLVHLLVVCSSTGGTVLEKTGGNSSLGEEMGEGAQWVGKASRMLWGCSLRLHLCSSSAS